MDTSHSILRSAKHFLAGTFLSRLSGLARDIAMAFSFGSSPEIAAFMVSYRLANLFRRLLGEGNLQAGFVPRFESLRLESRERAVRFYRDVSFSLSLVLLGLIVVLEAVFWGCSHWVSSDWKGIVELAMWMVPGLFFICLSALNSSLLQCEKKYFLPAAAPIAFNFVWIVAALSVWHLPKEEGIRWLALAVTGAFGAQWIATAVVGRRLLGKTFGWRPRLFSEDWKQLLKPLSLGIVGIGAVQFNSALDAIFARVADPEGPAFLWYAIRIEQLPLALFGIALSGALLPPLSRAMKSGDLGRYMQLLQSSLRHSAVLMLFCLFGILALGGAGINLLYGHGDFTGGDVRSTLYCLWAYGIGLVPSVFVLLLAAGFYARESYRMPTIAAVASVGLHIVLNALFVFVFHFGATSIALSTSFAAFLNAALLTRGLKENVGEIFTSSYWRFFFKTAVCCAIPAAFSYELGLLWMKGEFPRALPLQAAQFAVLSAIYLGGVAVLAWRLKIGEFSALLKRKRAES